MTMTQQPGIRRELEAAPKRAAGASLRQAIDWLRILLACKPVDFRNGIHGLAALCKRELAEDPFSGALFVFRNRRGTALKMLCYVFLREARLTNLSLCQDRLPKEHD